MAGAMDVSVTLPPTAHLAPGTLVEREAIKSNSPMGRTLSPSAGPKRFGCAGSGEFSLSLHPSTLPQRLAAHQEHHLN